MRGRVKHTEREKERGVNGIHICVCAREREIQVSESYNWIEWVWMTKWEAQSIVKNFTSNKLHDK